MRTAYLDCFAGISGDMFLSALLDAGLPETELRKIFAQNGIKNEEIQIKTVYKRGIRAISLQVTPDQSRKPLSVSQIRNMFIESGLKDSIISEMVAVFDSIIAAEASVHGCKQEKVHLHEISGLDTVIDIMGAAFGIDYLQLETIYASPPEVGTGTIRIAHGEVSVPAPATMELLKGIPIRSDGLKGERVTPTGAALLKYYVKRFRSFPPMKVSMIGHGAGQLDSGERPNILRIFIGNGIHHGFSKAVHLQELIVLETTIDDQTPEALAFLVEKLWECRDVLDVFSFPVYMKKNRVGQVLKILVQINGLHPVVETLFEHSRTLGIKYYPISRIALNRTRKMIETPFGKVRVTIAGTTVAAEYEDCRKCALDKNVPLEDVIRYAEWKANELRNHRAGCE